ncbi:MAG: elongation factor G [Burkholderiales bacterium]|nr:elongation factor G [Phycisphaerae bacterium]
MPAYSTDQIRNVLIVGHAGAGKTSLVDAMIFASGAKNHKGSTADGSSFSDFEKLEIEHRHSIYSSVLHCDHKGHRINLIDAPGSPDLVGAAIACLPAVETVAVVINAASGIEVVSRKMMEAAKDRNLPRAIIVNRIDQCSAAALANLVEKIREAFGAECLPINLPFGGNQGVVDCLLNSDGKSDFDTVKRVHAQILDQIVEMDDNLLEKYLGGEEPDYKALHNPFERAMDESHVIPILFTDAKNAVGIVELLDAITMHFPSPLEGNLRPFLTGEGDGDKVNERPFDYWNDPAKPLLAHVFKVTTDPFIGKMCVFRVHQGKLTGQSQVYIGHSKKSIKLGHVFHLQGKEHNEVNEIVAGDIGAVAKIEDLHFNDVLHDDHALDSVHLKPLTFPNAMFGLAIIPKARGDEVKIGQHLTKIAEEDPTFIWHVDKQTHELVINGVGELHLRMVLERLAQRGIAVETKPPKISYRETILSNSEGHHRHKKQTGGAGQFGEVFLRIEPLDSQNPVATRNGGRGFEFVDEIFGGTIPGQFVPAIQKGVHEAMEHGVIAGFPVQDIRVIVYDGKHHPVDSKEVAFKSAGKWAFIDAFRKARPALLEPIVSLEVTAPEDKLGVITGDLSGKRGRIMGTDILGGGQAKVTAEVPLAEVMQYQSQLKSVTGGQGTFVMDFARYEPAPPNIASRVTSAFKLAEEVD